MESNPNKSKLNSTIDSIIRDLCQKHQDSDDLEQSIIALFEDIIRFFSGREEDFVSFDDMSLEQKEELYNEISMLINLLKSLGQESDRQETIKILSQNLIRSFSKKSRSLTANHSQLSKAEEIRLKQEFSLITIQNLYNERQKAITKQSIKLKDKELEHISKKIENLRKSGMKFSSIIKGGDRSSIHKSR